MDVISLDNQIACVRRELSIRRRCYPGWIVSGKITQDWADFQMDAMEAVLKSLEALQDAEAHAEQEELFPAP